MAMIRKVKKRDGLTKSGNRSLVLLLGTSVDLRARLAVVVEVGWMDLRARLASSAIRPSRPSRPWWTWWWTCTLVFIMVDHERRSPT